MKRIATLTAGVLLGLEISMAGMAAPVTTVYAESQASEMTVIESKDDDIFKVAQLRPERMLEEYKLAKYDTIDVKAIGYPEGYSSGLGIDELTIGVDGMVRLPYSGNVKLAGLTLDEARDLIYETLSPYFRLPELNVYLKTYGPRKIYVMGNVNNPGIQNMNVDNMNVYAAITSAGGVDKKGRSKHIQLIRQMDGVFYYREINIDAFVKKHDVSQNIQLEDGDIIYVPDSGKVIFGEDVAPYINIWATYKSITN